MGARGQETQDLHTQTPPEPGCVVTLGHPGVAEAGASILTEAGDAIWAWVIGKQRWGEKGQGGVVTVGCEGREGKSAAARCPASGQGQPSWPCK